MLRRFRFAASVVPLLAVASCQGDTDCICTPVGDFTRTVEITTDGSCGSIAASEPELYSSCVENSGSNAPLGPSAAFRLRDDAIWSSIWPATAPAPRT